MSDVTHFQEQISLLEQTLYATRRERDRAEERVSYLETLLGDVGIDAEQKVPETAFHGNWIPRGDDVSFELEDGDSMLVAVKCADDSKREYWEYAVITIHCDETECSFTCAGEPWGWDWEDVEYFIPLNRKKLGVKKP